MSQHNYTRYVLGACQEAYGRGWEVDMAYRYGCDACDTHHFLWDGDNRRWICLVCDEPDVKPLSRLRVTETQPELYGTRAWRINGTNVIDEGELERFGLCRRENPDDGQMYLYPIKVSEAPPPAECVGSCV